MLKLGHEEKDIDLDVAERLGLLRLPYDVTDTGEFGHVDPDRCIARIDPMQNGIACAQR